MTPDLSRRLGRALGQHEVTPAERQAVTEAAAVVDTFDQLPQPVRDLIAEIEARPGGLPSRIQRLVDTRPPKQSPPASL